MGIGRIRVKGIHWAVQAQLLRRGGVRSGPVTPPNQVDTKVAALRQAAKSEATGSTHYQHRRSPRAGRVQRHPRGGYRPHLEPSREVPLFRWHPYGRDAPTVASGARPHLASGPPPGSEVCQGAQPTDPLVKVRREALDAVATSPEGQAVAASPDRNRTYVHTRLAEARLGHQALTLEDVLRDASDLGGEELSTMAETVLDHLGLLDPTPDRKSGAAPVEVGLTDWSRGFLGVAMVSWHGEEWRALDYGYKLPLGPEPCEQFRKPADTLETRQCLLKSVAAAGLHAQDGQLLAHGQVLSAAQTLRTSHWWFATEAAVALGDCPRWISPEENAVCSPTM